MQKTEKTITEMEIDQNYSFEFDRIQEAGNNLPPLHGPGYKLKFEFLMIISFNTYFFNSFLSSPL